MNKKYLTILFILVTMILSACGSAPAEPTLTVEQLQGTAAANVWLSVTQTVAALPTATASPIPPTAVSTETPMPVITIIDTLPPPVTATNTESPCNQPPPMVSKGQLVPVKFVNKSGGNVNLSFVTTRSWP